MKKYAIIKENSSTGQYEYQLWRTVPGQADVLVTDWQYGPFRKEDCIKQVQERFVSDYECTERHDAEQWVCEKCCARRGKHRFKTYECPRADVVGADKLSLFIEGQRFQTASV